MLSDICFEQIYDDFYLAQLDNFHVVMMKSCGWINATKFCKDSGLKFGDWSGMEQSKRLIKALETELGSPAMKTFGADNYAPYAELVTGTFIHSALLPHVGCWVSPVFALKISKISITNLVQEYLAKRAEGKALTTLNTKAVQFDATLTWLPGLIHQIHSFTMLRLNDELAKMPYYAIRCKRHCMQKRINGILCKHPRASIIYQQSTVPDAVNMYKQLRKSGKITTHGCYCMPYIPEVELIKTLNELSASQRSEHR